MAAPSRITVAAAQYPLDRLADIDALAGKLDRWIGDAARHGADLVVFPEYGAMELAGLASDAIASDLHHSLAAVADTMAEIDTRQQEIARRHRIHVLAASGPHRRADGRYANAARLITPDGGTAIIEKVVMTPFERDWGIVGGARPSLVETDIGRIGVLICYDSEFPLLARALVEAGADIIVVPACTERVSGFNRVRTAALARALEGTVPTVLSPTIGDAPWSPAVDRNAGAAGIYLPAEHGISDTGVLAEGRLNEPGLVVASIDLARLADVRTAGEMRNRADWSIQPGATPLPACDRIDLSSR